MTPLWFPSSRVRPAALLAALLLICITGSAQVGLDQAADTADPAELAPMQAPPPVSLGAYSTAFASETVSDHLQLGLTMTGSYSNNIAAYSSNVLVNQAAVPGESLSIWPTIALEKGTPRSHYIFNYSPGFTIYSPSSVPNQTSQNASFTGQYRLSPNITAGVGESFNQTSNIFNQPNPLDAVSISGAVPPPQQAVISAAANQRMNGTAGQVTYQCGENCLLGAGGGYDSLQYSGRTQDTGLYNSSSGMASMFYSRRLRGRYYLGTSYQFQNFSSYESGTKSGLNTNTQSHAVFAFLTIYFSPKFSLSLSEGPQHFTTTQGPLPSSRSWFPMTMVSLGWQGTRTSLSVSYSRIVTAAGGLNGLFQSDNVGVSGRWQMSRNWIMGLSTSYGQYQNLLTLSPSATSGHTVLGTASVQRPLGEHLGLQAGYNRIQQSYRGTVSTIPTADRLFISITYQFTKPL